MEFCEKCGGMIMVTDGKAACASCGHKVRKRIKIEVSEKMKNEDSVTVIHEGENETNPIVEITCPECKHKKAYFWTMQTRSSDESETKFYKCTNPKCHHTWRKYR